MTEDFKILTPRDHIRLRIGMYLGSTSKTEQERYVKGEWKTITYIPALFKCVNEIIDNSIDEAIRTGFKHANKIEVGFNMDSIFVEDNGRGIPQEQVHDTVTGEKLLRPVAAWTKVNAGTSFTDERVTIGANGVGSSAVNFTSSWFMGETWQKGKMISVECHNGADSIEVKETKRSGSGTRVEFTPDLSLFETESIHADNLATLVEDRLINLQVAYPEIKFKFNGQPIAFRNFKEYAKNYGVTVHEESPNLSFLIASSEDGFRSNSFVNGVNTHLGGTYVDLIANGVSEELVSMVKRKHKIEVGKNTIKAGLALVLFARNFVNPRFDSQTKERLTSTVGDTKKHYNESGVKDILSIAKKILNTPEIIDPIIEAQLAKKIAAEKRAATLAQKGLRRVKVAKHVAASTKDASLHLVEGDSALGPSVQVRDPKKHGFFPLRGVVKNTWELKPSEVLSNKELSDLVAVLGLDITDKDSWTDMNYQNVNIMSDADVDGGKIATLLVAFFTKFWPGMVDAGRLAILRSPVLISTKGKDVKWFYDLAEAVKFKEEAPGYYHRYIKGLGSLQTEEYQEIIHNPKLDVISLDKEYKEYMEIMFGGSADARKVFMMA